MFDAQLICDILISHGVNAQVRGGFLTGATGELPVEVSVWVGLEDDELKAREIVEAAELARKDTAYVTECGECGSEVESNFSQCWHCGSTLF